MKLSGTKPRWENFWYTWGLALMIVALMIASGVAVTVFYGSQFGAFALVLAMFLGFAKMAGVLRVLDWLSFGGIRRYQEGERAWTARLKAENKRQREESRREHAAAVARGECVP